MIGPARMADRLALDREVEALLDAQAEILGVDHLVAERLEDAALHGAVAVDAVVDDGDGAHGQLSLHAARPAWVVRSSRLRILPLGFLGSPSATTT